MKSQRTKKITQMGAGARVFLAFLALVIIWGILTAAFGTNKFRIDRQPLNVENFTEFPYTGFFLVSIAVGVTFLAAYMLKPTKNAAAKEGSPF